MPIIRHGYALRRGRRGKQHAVIAKQVLAEEHLCFYCGGPALEDDPLEAAHLIAWSLGGPDDRANMRAAHRSCNRKRGAA